jgi:hypothetical protein
MRARIGLADEDVGTADDLGHRLLVPIGAGGLKFGV